LNPSEAQAYALIEVLGIPKGEDPISTLETFLAREGLADELALHRGAWARAAARTPHGEPIELSPEDFARAGSEGAPSPPSR